MNNKQKLVNYLTTNPQILTQLLRLIGEDVNVVKKDGKDAGDYRDYDSPDSEWEEPYKIAEFLTTLDMSKII